MRIAEHEVRRVSVLGYGRTGRAVSEYFYSHDVEVFVSDSRALGADDTNHLSARGIPYEQAGHTVRVLEGTDLVIISPGIRPDLPILQKVRETQTQIISELDLAFLLIPDTPLIAITGTNGKSTTVKLVEEILRQVGIKAIAAGNIGLPAITLADNPPEVVVLEVSSFQLEQSRIFRPSVACLLNIAPDHLDRHGSMDRYVAAKLSIFDRQTNADLAIASHEVPLLRGSVEARIVCYEDVTLPKDVFVDSLSSHNRSNLRAAIACCKGVIPTLDESRIDLRVLKGAFHLPYRMQEEPSLGGLRVINDSKSTNAASAITALQAIDGPCVLILGGRHKRAGYEQLASIIVQRDVRRVILFGEGATLLRLSLRDVGYARVTLCSTLDHALKCALKEAREGDTILFSPACSSYDQYSNYVERGEHFSHLVRSALEQQSPNR